MRRETGVDYVAVVVVCHRGWPEYVDDNTQKRCPTASHANQVCLCVSESELICMQFIGANFMQIPGKHSMLGAGWVFKLGAFCDESTQRAHTAHRPSDVFVIVWLCVWRMLLQFHCAAGRWNRAQFYLAEPSVRRVWIID